MDLLDIVADFVLHTVEWITGLLFSISKKYVKWSWERYENAVEIAGLTAKLSAMDLDKSTSRVLAQKLFDNEFRNVLNFSDMTSADLESGRAARVILKLKESIQTISCYTGEVDIYGRKSGRGVYRYKEGGVYNGNWWSDKRQGFGKFFYADGTIYLGGWKNDKREGDGVIFDSYGEVLRFGKWRDDILVSRFVSNSTEWDYRKHYRNPKAYKHLLESYVYTLVTTKEFREYTEEDKATLQLFDKMKHSKNWFKPKNGYTVDELLRLIPEYKLGDFRIGDTWKYEEVMNYYKDICEACGFDWQVPFYFERFLETKKGDAVYFTENDKKTLNSAYNKIAFI